MWTLIDRKDLKVGDVITVFHDSVENMGRLPSHPYEETIIGKFEDTLLTKGVDCNLTDILGRYGVVYRKSDGGDDDR